MRKTALALMVALGFSGVVFAGSATTAGIYTATSEPVIVTDANSMEGSSKNASGSNVSILWLIAFGDGSIDSLANSAGIQKVTTVEKNTFSLGYLIPLFWQVTFTVYGE